MATVSGFLPGGAPAVHQGYERARQRILVASGSQLYAGDFVLLDSSGRANPSGSTANANISASLQGAAFLGITQDSSPTFDPYHTTINPAITVLIGGIALVSCVSGTYTIGQKLYLNNTARNLVTSTSSGNGTSIGEVSSPFGTALGQDFYSPTITQLYIALASPVFVTA